MNSTAVLKNVNPAFWRNHRYGISPERWQWLHTRSFWITGGGTGYGRAMAVALGCAGAQVFISGRRREKLDETIVEIGRLGGKASRCQAVPMDLTCADEVERACAWIRDHCTTLCGLINNAALSQPRQYPWPLQQDSLASWNRMIQTNLTAPWLVSTRILPHMVQGGEVRILFLTSEAGWAPTSGFGQYNVTKAGLNSLGASLAEECAARYPDQDIQINVLSPGEARTEMNQGSSRGAADVVPMVLHLLTHPRGGPNGRFFHADGRHLAFGHTAAHQLPQQVASLRGFNIVRFGAWHYALPHELGAIRLEEVDGTLLPGVLRMPSREDLEAVIGKSA